MEAEAATAGNNDVQQAKARMREQIRAELRAITAAERAASSLQACDLLEKQPVWQKAAAILLFAPLPDEPDLWQLLEASLAAGRTIALPQYNRALGAYVPALIRHAADDLAIGRFGVREPAAHCPTIPLNRLDFMLVPGVAFDVEGRRLGRGKGYYDRFLAAFAGVACGVAFDRQLVPRVPSEAHDARVNCILTPTRWLVVSANARF